MKKNCTLDNLDRKILERLQNNCRITTEELGHDIGLSATACQRRIKRLRQAGVIEKEVAILNPDGISDYVTLIVQVTMKEGCAHYLDRFKEKVLMYAEIQQCYYVAGNMDFVLIVTANSMKQYDQLSRDLFSSDVNVQKFETIVVMDCFKAGLNFPIASL